MFDGNTIRICEDYAFLSPEPDAVEAEFLELHNTTLQNRYLRRVCVRWGLPTRLDIAMPYKGRTYFDLSRHPVIRRRKKRMKELRIILRERGTLRQLEQMADSRTCHWFNRRVA